MLDVMRSNRRHPKLAWGALGGLTIGLLAVGPAAVGQSFPEADSGADAQATQPSLPEHQRVVRDRVERLESTMLKLSQLLAESEPAKAERLRDALQFAGSHRIKARIDTLIELLRSDQLSEGDRQQELLLADLDALLTLLTSSLNEVERRRAERQQLEALKRIIRTLMDEQTQILYRTQHVQQHLELSGSEPADAATAGSVAEMLHQLEERQRSAQRQAGDLQRDMHKPAEEDRPTPGTPQVARAAEDMQQAADRLGERQPGAARQNQQGALEQLQQALDELDDALRQVRREESEETLAALEARLRSMLTREKQVREAVLALDEKSVENWTRVDRLRLAESAEMQRGVHDDCEATLRILVDEGTTVVVPELMRQVAVDMADVSARLDRSDTSTETQRVLSNVIAVLEEVLEAVERKREADASLDSGEQPSGDQPRPLLPNSAELKLLRSSQMRLNERTLELAVSNSATNGDGAAIMQALSLRQGRLAELARRMNERR
jgi:hypothetical protein